MKVLTAKQAALIQLAKELDDFAPDELCPGCQRVIDGITTDTHLANNDPDNPQRCAWSKDHLVARAMRRRLIRTGTMT